MARVRCSTCQRELSRYTDEGDQCKVCRRTSRTAGYCALWDPVFVERVAWLLITRWGRWVRVGRETGAMSNDVRGAVTSLRRRWAFIIEGDRRLGYRLTGWCRPQRSGGDEDAGDNQTAG